MVNERGALETTVAFLMAGLAAIAMLLLMLVALLVRHQEAVAAADLAALAGAQAADCAQAAASAVRNHAVLEDCSMQTGRIEVHVTVPSGIPSRFAVLGAPMSLGAMARAIVPEPASTLDP